MFVITAILLGLVGSLHCVGMCGPIALALPLQHHSTRSRLSGITQYNLGKALTYALLGAISGIAGSTVRWAGGQQTLSIVAGTLILLALIGGLVGKKFPMPAFLNKPFGKVREQLGKLFKQKRAGALLMIGLLNGLLPCGLVYAALAGAAATGSAVNGALFMFAFGVGTIPALFTLSYAGAHLSNTFRQRLRRLVPVFVGVMAVLLIVRGLGLGIPYVSPTFVDNKVESCCHRHHK